MAKDCFTFKQFSVHQERCSMKVGTDGTLLGAWAHAPEGKCRILDIGVGTGLISLMMAQRYPNAHITGIDIDSEACLQAIENVIKSPFSERISIVKGDIAFYDSEPFDAIVSNPPFFLNSLECPDKNRTIARHSQSLSYKTLLKSTSRLLKDTGLFSLIIPKESLSSIESEASLNRFILSRKYSIKTTPKKSPKRYLLEYVKTAFDNVELKEEILELSPKLKSEWYKNLTDEFYL